MKKATDEATVKFIQDVAKICWDTCPDEDALAVIVNESKYKSYAGRHDDEQRAAGIASAYREVVNDDGLLWGSRTACIVNRLIGGYQGEKWRLPIREMILDKLMDPIKIRENPWEAIPEYFAAFVQESPFEEDNVITAYLMVNRIMRDQFDELLSPSKEQLTALRLAIETWDYRTMKQVIASIIKPIIDAKQYNRGIFGRYCDKYKVEDRASELERLKNLFQCETLRDVEQHLRDDLGE